MGDLTLVGDDMLVSGNVEEYFDSKIIEKLGHYVYVLCDPRDSKVFYVGKAGGTKGLGNNRVFSHFDAAREVLNGNVRDMDQKTRRILEIWSADEQVSWYIVRHGLPNEETALHVEAALIDVLSVSQNGPALNLVRGHGASLCGILTQDMVREFGAKPIAPLNRYSVIFIFPIQNAIARGENVYEATRKAWAVSESLRDEKDAVAVGVANGIAKGVFKVDGWKKYEPGVAKAAGTKNWDNGVAPLCGKMRTKNLWAFNGVPLEESELLAGDFSAVITTAMGYWQRGNYLVISIDQIDGEMCFRFLRGCQDKKDFFEF